MRQLDEWEAAPGGHRGEQVMLVLGTVEASIRGSALVSILIQVFLWNIILRHFPRLNFRRIRIWRILHRVDGFSFESLPLFSEFFNALGVGLGRVR
jgi:hypothetical protein